MSIKVKFKDRFMRKILMLLFALVNIGNVCSQQLKLYPNPDIIPQNNDFTVRVRIPGGMWQELYAYNVQIDSHKVKNSSMVTFEFDGTVEVEVTSNKQAVQTARIRPLSYQIPHTVIGNKILFTLTQPTNISVEVNKDIFQNLHLFANGPEENVPSDKDPNVVYLKPGTHDIETLKLKSNQSLYLAGGAVLKGKILCEKVKNVRIFGRGIVFQPHRGVEITHSSNVSVEDLIFINPTHYTVFGGQSNHLNIKNIRSFSSRGWSDGIDLMSCSDVLIDGVFMRNSDDCIAIYCHRWDYYGDARNIMVQNATLWADVAHPIMLGTHGNPDPEKAEIIENIVFRNIDILNHDEPQIDYQGCMAINVSDENLARNILFENIRVEDFERGQLINLRVTFNKKYAKAPGRGIENVYFRNITYNGSNANISILEGYSEDRSINNVVFENLIINGTEISPAAINPGHMKLSDFARFYEGLYVSGIKYKSSNENTGATTK